MPSYIELSKILTPPSASSDSTVILSVGAGGDIIISSNTGTTSSVIIESASYALSASYASGAFFATSASYSDVSYHATSASYAMNGGGGGSYPDITDDTVNHFVGINNVSPSASLDVSGDIHLTGFIGNQSVMSPNSNFIGTSAGYGVVNANNSNFIGLAAGTGAENASNSNFLGQNAGDGAHYGANSNFFGRNAGGGATNANNSIFIGNNAGHFDTVNNSGGSSSILIGDNTSTNGFSDSIAIGAGTQNSSTRQLNLGNVIFANGINTTTTPSSASQTDCKVGICTNIPQYTLDVSGSIKSTEMILPILNPNASNTGSMYYSASNLWIYTGTPNNFGAGIGWSSASVSF